MKKILNHIQNNALIDIDKPVVVAVSSGVDSMVLLDILLHFNYQCIIAHINHQKRIESNDEYTFLKTYAKKANIPFEGLLLEANNANFHDEAHYKRLRFFKTVAKKHNTNQVVLAHHLDDQIETILMRIVRGTRFENYAGIKEKYMEDNVFFIRPLLAITKNDILEYAKNHKIQYFEDTSNKEDTYTRNRYRHHIIPSIEKENPNYRDKISQLSDMITHASSLVQTECDTYIKSLKTLDYINIDGFNTLNKLVKIAVLTYLINTVSKNTIEVSYHQYESMIELCESDKPNQFLTLNETYSFIKNYDTFSIKPLKKPTTINVEINDYGTYQVTDKISYIITPNKIGQNNRNYFELWYNGLVFPLYLRNRVNGDKMQLKVGTKKVKDILIDQKIPIQLRDSLVLLADNESVLWIPGIKKKHQNQTQQNKLYVYEVTKC